MTLLQIYLAGCVIAPIVIGLTEDECLIDEVDPFICFIDMIFWPLLIPLSLYRIGCWLRKKVKK